ncbi:MAG: photosynthetic protein synthase I [Deltaproteobacteria bacterium]|nr:photosynthetic protein synthase I [Deltaproteobacteria bacterium]
MKTKFGVMLAMAAWLGIGILSAADIGPLPKVEFDAKKAAIGKRLFFDKRLSGDVALSCSSCHDPTKGFADGKPLSDAYPGTEGFRNTPSVINTTFKDAWFHDGRIGTDLNDVTREMITETIWMNMDMRIMQERIKQDPVYIKMFADAGWGEPSNGKVRNAIPEYLKSLTSRNAPFDSGKMSAAAKAGQSIFTGKGGCVKCHNGPLFSDQKLHKLGVPENKEIFQKPLRHVAFIAFTKSMGIDNYMNLRQDPGGAIRNNYKENLGTFMTPSLRELKYTAPYMHNGMLKTLKDVVDFYNKGAGKGSGLKALKLSSKEQSDLVAFLEALSGDPLNGPDHVWSEKIDVNYKPIPDWWKARN